MIGFIVEVLMTLALIFGVCYIVAWGIVTMVEEIWKMRK